MLFKDLLKLKKDYVGLVNYYELRNLLPETPEEVLEQFFYDHGQNGGFQNQYSNIDINKLKWCKKKAKAKDIIECSIYERFYPWVNSVSERLKYFEKNSYSCIDVRKDVVDYWSKNYTWMKAPIFLEGKILDSKKKIHLVEGHTRLGILIGLLNNKIIEKNTLHEIWYGSY
ncbi:hypothetical protein CRV08_04800 [Halarcobacter ebronensis]|uniref:Uncharacterized protein n=1 Tax=Halarcobacter ebronensis TaxID=1462615 RepID=A0A4Q0YFI8_9BACT|nr:hypothetical protein [Halarcobacter ebronensis]RXJ69330.1 hypothetical protein CRV08_04800 [Halarcobacter ebronensis]